MMAYFYDGGLTPPRPESMPAEVPMPGSGIMFVGAKGIQVSAFYGGNPWTPFGSQPRPGVKVRGLPGGWLLPERQFKDFQHRITIPNGFVPAKQARNRLPRSNSPAA
jgi:hypothetical protein